MSNNKQTIIAFDLYGTLLSTESVAKELSTHFGDEKASNVAALWRRYQLEYTWRLNSMNQYQPFSTITLNSLHHALGDSSLSLSSLQIDSLIKSYDALSTFPDVSPALQSLANEKNITPVIFSNGTESMVYNSVYSSPSLSPHAHVFRDIITVEQVEKFKPDPSAYYHLAEKMGKGRDEKSMGEMWLVSGNPFDVVGARAVGMKAAWVDRVGKGWTDRLLNGEKARPTIVVAGLGEAVEGVRGLSGG